MRKEVDQYIELARKLKKLEAKPNSDIYLKQELYKQSTKIYDKLDDKERIYAQKALRGEVLEGLGAQGQMIDSGDEVSIVQKAISKLPARVQSLIKPEQKYKVLSALGDTATLAVSGMKVNLPTSFLNKPITWESKKLIESYESELKKLYLSGATDEEYKDLAKKYNKPISQVKKDYDKLENELLENKMKINKSTLKKVIHETVLTEVAKQEVENLVSDKAEAAMRYKKASTGEVKTYFGRFTKISGDNVYVGVLGKGLRAFKIANIQSIQHVKLEAAQLAELDEMCGKKEDEVVNEAKRRNETQALRNRNSNRMAAARKAKKKNEACPPGFSGTVKAMKKHPEKFEKECAILEKMNPYALAWWMKKKGYKSHYTAGGKKK